MLSEVPTTKRVLLRQAIRRAPGDRRPLPLAVHVSIVLAALLLALAVAQVAGGGW